MSRVATTADGLERPPMHWGRFETLTSVKKASWRLLESSVRSRLARATGSMTAAFQGLIILLIVHGKFWEGSPVRV